jgi:hypothetical protein
MMFCPIMCMRGKEGYSTISAGKETIDFGDPLEESLVGFFL